MTAVAAIKCKIFYQLTAIKRDADGNELSRRESDLIPNVFTNWGVESLYSAPGADAPGAIAAVVGTGNTPPDITQTQMASFLAGRFNSQTPTHAFVDLGSNQGYIEKTYNTIFPVGVATGNISEVGACFKQSNPVAGDELISRALVVDGVGNPTTFEVQADEELQLTQFFRVYINYAVRSTVMNINGVDYTITWQPYGLNSPGFWPVFQSLGLTGFSAVWFGEGITFSNPISGTGPTATGAGAGSTNTSTGAQEVTHAYVANSKQRALGIRLPTGTARNMVGWDTSRCGHGSWQVGISPPLPKSALERFTGTLMFMIDNTP